MKRVIGLMCIVSVMLLTLSALPMSVSASGKGDYNNDGIVTSMDVRKMLNDMTKSVAPTQKQVWWCDYDQDGTVSTIDARKVLIRILDSNKAIDYANVTNTDCWGEKSVAILGDSISFGAGAEGELADNCYAGIVKKAVSAANGSTNYGFMSAYTTNWAPRSSEVCEWPAMTGGPDFQGKAGAWEETDNGNYLMTVGLTAYKQYASLTYTLKSGYNFNYVCVYYQTGPNRGQFTVANNVDGAGYDQSEVGEDYAKVYDCENTVEETKRTGFFEVSKFTNGISLNIVSADNSPVTITGLGFYNDISGEQVTFNKYCRGGAMLSNLSDAVLSQAASAGTLIVGLGYNDAFWGHGYGYTKETFSNRIDYLIAEANKNGTNVIVNDYLWNNYREQASYINWDAAVQADIDEKFVFFSEELKRLAKETGGIYIDQEAVNGTPLMDAVNANDGVHPLNAGHTLMAQSILEAMGLR